MDLPGWRPLFDKADRPSPGLLERLRGCDAAVLLDAMHAGGETGAVRQVERRELATADRLFSGHALGVAEALALGSASGCYRNGCISSESRWGAVCRPPAWTGRWH